MFFTFKKTVIFALISFAALSNATGMDNAQNNNKETRNVEYYERLCQNKKFKPYGYTSLQFAVRDNNLEVIEELIKLAKELDAAGKRGEELGLSNDEVAFYDALSTNDSAVEVMGDKQLKLIAAELITQVRKSVTIDWQHREGARAKIRVIVKRILKKYGYPPDLEEEAVKTVLLQAELLCADWV